MKLSLRTLLVATALTSAAALTPAFAATTATPAAPAAKAATTAAPATTTVKKAAVTKKPAAPAAAIQTVKLSLDGEADQPMSIKADVPSVKAGVVQFVVTNDAISTDHEVVLVKLKSKDQMPPVDAKSHRIDEGKLKSMGEVSGLIPGKSGKLKVKLAAGDYMLLCNIKGHFEHGMHTSFTVTK